MQEGPAAKIGAAAGVAAILVSYLIAAAQSHWWPFQSRTAAQQKCAVNQFEHLDDEPDRLRPPRGLSVTWEKSATVEGRVSATVHWINVDSRTTFGLIEVAGRFGTPDENDEPTRTDGRSLPAEGLCGHWYRQYNRSDDGERGVFFDGLWPAERYCFAVDSSPASGGRDPGPYPSINTPAVCQDSP